MNSPTWLKLLLVVPSFFLISGTAQPPAAEELDWPNFQFELIRPHTQMTHITHAGDGSGRLFVVEKAGNIRVVQLDQLPDPLSTNRFLSISDRVLAGGERGLFSVAFAPDFKVSGEFYVNYTRKPDGATIVSRFKVGSDTNLVDATTEQILLLVPQPAANHNGGQLAFGPDGYLYIGMGDGGGQGDPNNTAQNPLTLLGKMLRIDVAGSSTNYAVPSSNPFVGRGDVLPEIWASGLRNPWRFSFDRLTGDLFIADVGELRLEEINFQPANSVGGENYGWSLFEGTLPFKVPSNPEATNQLTFPVATYPRALGQSITGGHVIRGNPSSERSHGVYIYSDFMTGRLGGLKQIDGKWIQADFGIYSNAVRRPLQLTSFGEDEEGNLYAVESGINSNGSVYRVYDRKQVVAPVISKRGTFTNEQTVTLSTVTPRARVHYTLDGTTPTLESPSVASGESIIISESGVLRAQGYRNDLEPSPVVLANFTLALRLTLNPNATSVTNGTLLTFHTPVSNVVIRYTLDGSQPSETSPTFENPISLQGDQTVRVLATRPGWVSAETNVYFGRLIPEWVSVQTYAGGGVPGVFEGPARSVHFSKPLALAMLPSGDLLVGDLASKTVRKIATNGLVSTLWNDFHPTAFYVDGTGAVYTLEYNYVRRTVPGNASTLYIAGDWHRPSGVAITTNGAALVSADGHAIRATSSQIVLLHQAPSSNPIDGGWDVALSTNGTSYWTGARGVFTFDSENKRQPFAGGHLFDYPGGHSDGPRLTARFSFPATSFDHRHKSLTFDASQNLYVADGNLIRKIDSGGTVSTLLERTPLEAATSIGVVGGIVAHPNGDLFVVDTASATIKRISLDSDRDKVPDTDEIVPFTLGADDRLIDTDSDGASNAAEYLGGTDPLNSSSLPRLVVATTDDRIQLTWTGISPRGDLFLEGSSDLLLWLTLTNAFTSGGTEVSAATGTTFFRARLE